MVHGGGPEINTLAETSGDLAEFRDGLRVTDPDTTDVVEMVLVGRVSRSNGLNKLGARAVGPSGATNARKPALGQWQPWARGRCGPGQPRRARTTAGAGHVPVISSVAATRDGTAHNINADTVAGELAAALEAEKLILLHRHPLHPAGSRRSRP